MFSLQASCPRWVLLACLALSGCVSGGESKIIPPAPTASPGVTSVFLYVAEARDPALGTSGGRVIMYQLGSDGLLPASPIASTPVVNARRLIKHPVLPVLYVASANQILAFDIEGGKLESLCGSGAGLAPPCATDPIAGSSPIDMTITQTEDGNYFLYATDQGNGQFIDIQTKLSAYPLGPQGELPGNASSQVQEFDSINFGGAAPLPDLGFIYVSDTGAQLINRYILQADGNLPSPPTSPTPVGAPTPTPTPEGPTPTPSPSPSPLFVRGPGRILPIGIPPSPSPGVAQQTFLYVIVQFQKRIAAYPVLTPSPEQSGIPGDLPENPTSESNTRGVYNAILVNPTATNIYGAAFNDGQIDFYRLESDGNIIDSSEGSTFADTTSYPTGLAWLEQTLASGETQTTIFVSLGGSNRIDAYAVGSDGSLPQRPFSSTTPIDGTFPADVLVYVP